MTTHPVPDGMPTEEAFYINGAVRVPARWPDSRKDDATDLANWWVDLAHSDLEMLLPKAVEYSAHDLIWTGETLAQMFGTEVAPWCPDPDVVTGAELTCWVYLLSKVMRAVGAIKEGRAPSDDTLRDIRVYATMIARIRSAGAWPGWTK